MALTEEIQGGGINSQDLHEHPCTKKPLISRIRFSSSCLFPQINLQRRMRVTGLITQGAKRIGSPEYVKSYKVAYSDDGKTWRTYKVKGRDEDMVRHARAHGHAYACRLSPPSRASPSVVRSQSCTRPHAHTCTNRSERLSTQSRTA